MLPAQVEQETFEGTPAVQKLVFTEIERRFRKWARELVLDGTWSEHRSQIYNPKGPYAQNENMRRAAILQVVRLFAQRYRDLLERAATEHADLWMSKGLEGSDTDVSRAAIQCASRFLRDEYARPWQGFFVARPRPTDPQFDTQDVDPLAVRSDFRSVQTAWFETWFEIRCESQRVLDCFGDELHGWKDRAAGELKLKIALGAVNGGSAVPVANHRPATELPKTWDELRKRGSISQSEASRLLACSRKTIGRRVDASELKQSSKGRIVCDDFLKIQIRKVHGEHVLR